MLHGERTRGPSVLCQTRAATIHVHEQDGGGRKEWKKGGRKTRKDKVVESIRKRMGR